MADKKSLPKLSPGAGLAILLLVLLILTGCSTHYGEPYDSVLNDANEVFQPALIFLRLLFILAGLALLIAGYKIYRPLIAIPGLLLGALGGAALGTISGEPLLTMVGLVAGGLLGAVLVLYLHDIGIIIVGALTGAALFGEIAPFFSGIFQPWVFLIAGAVIGAFGLLALAHIWIVALAAAVGAFLFALGIDAGLGWAILFFFIGIGLQYLLARALGETLPPIGRSKKAEPPPPPVQEPPAVATQLDPARTQVETVLESTGSVATLVTADGRSFTLTDGFKIGRSASCDLVVPGADVSHIHAQIRYGGGNWFLQDQNSASGTFVNGEQIVATKLAGGDFIEIGDAKLRFNASNQ